jgi:hypothetical protein
MSVAELKAQAETLSPQETSELSRYVRALDLQKNPARQAQLKSALKNPKWITQEEADQTLAELEKHSR